MFKVFVTNQPLNYHELLFYSVANVITILMTPHR